MPQSPSAKASASHISYFCDDANREKKKKKEQLKIERGKTRKDGIGPPHGPWMIETPCHCCVSLRLCSVWDSSKSGGAKQEPAERESQKREREAAERIGIRPAWDK